MWGEIKDWGAGGGGVDGGDRKTAEGRGGWGAEGKGDA